MFNLFILKIQENYIPKHCPDSSEYACLYGSIYGIHLQSAPILICAVSIAYFSLCGCGVTILRVPSLAYSTTFIDNRQENVKMYIEVRSEVTQVYLQITRFFLVRRFCATLAVSPTPPVVSTWSGYLSAISRAAVDLPTPSELRDRSIWVRGSRSRKGGPLFFPLV